MASHVRVCSQVHGRNCITAHMHTLACAHVRRDALDRIQIEPIFYMREDYKTAGHLFTERGFTRQHREQTTSLLQVPVYVCTCQSVYDQGH